MREDATCWLNLGDSYASGKGTCYNPGGGSNSLEAHADRKDAGAYPLDRGNKSDLAAVGLKPKDLMMIPARVALALQADGWWLRSDIIWAKGLSFCDTYSGSCMPESVTDRPTKAHEYVFLLAKSAKYFYDSEAVREASAGTPHAPGNKTTGRIELGNRQRTGGTLEPDRTWASSGGRNLRTVWTINPGNFPGAHFAVFPPALVEPMIKSGTSERGACPNCGAAWERVVERKRDSRSAVNGAATKAAMQGPTGTERRLGPNGWNLPQAISTTIGWRPTCDCDAGEPVPYRVLDPFGGSGTVGLVCDQLGRDAVLIELNEDYVQMAHDRIYNDAPLFAQVEVMA